MESRCPFCASRVLVTCTCMEAHARCFNGHAWHYEFVKGAQVLTKDDPDENPHSKSAK